MVLKCLYCNSIYIIKDGNRLNAKGIKKQKYLCNNCNSRFSLNPAKIFLSAEEKSFLKANYKTKSAIALSKELSRSKSAVYRYIKGFDSDYYTNKNLIYYDLSDKEALGEFLGAFAGDGNLYCNSGVYRITISLNCKEIDYATYLSVIISKLFGKTPRLYKVKGSKVLNVIVFGKYISLILKSYLYIPRNCKTKNIKLLGDVSGYDNKFLKGFVRGLISTDGYVHLNKPRINFYTISRNLANNFSDILNILGIECLVYKEHKISNYKDYYIFSIYIQKKDSLYKFYRDIGMNEPLRYLRIKSIVNKLNGP